MHGTAALRGAPRVSVASVTVVELLPLELGPPLGLESLAGLTVGAAGETTVTASERLVLDRRVAGRQVRGALARGRLGLAHRPIRQLANAAAAKPLATLREQDGVLRVDMTPERLRVAGGQGSKPNTIVLGPRPSFEKRRHLAQPLLHLGVLVREGVHRSAVARQLRLGHERLEEHSLLAIVMEMTGELGEERGEPPAVIRVRSAVEESVDVRAERSEHPIDQHVFILERVD